MISEAIIDKALEYLRDTAPLAAKARAERHYLEEYKKSKKALLMGKHLDQAVNAQEREALSDPEYIEFLRTVSDAIEADETYRFKREAAQAIINAWQTDSANKRIVGKII